MKTSDRYSEIQAFVFAIQRQGIGQAAAALNVAASVISRRLSALEKRLGTRLVERSTRTLRLTEAGSFYYQRMQDWLADVDDADARLADWQQRVTGNLRMALPNVLGRLHIAPLLPTLLERYPELRLELIFSDRVEDLLAGGFDLAIRTGQLHDSRLVARKLADSHRLLVASPDYLQKHGTPTHPAELGDHVCLPFAVRDQLPQWQFQRGNEQLQVTIDGRLQANQGEALLSAALAGFGITQLARYLINPALERGELVALLPDWQVPATGIYAVWPSARFTPLKVRVVLEFFVDYFRQQAF